MPSKIHSNEYLVIAITNVHPAYPDEYVQCKDVLINIDTNGFRHFHRTPLLDLAYKWDSSKRKLVEDFCSILNSNRETQSAVVRTVKTKMSIT